jgi:hypothetical protein
MGCIEMRGAIDPLANHHETAETVALYLLGVAILVGPLLTVFTWPTRQMSGEVHIAPAVCREVIAGRRIRDLRKLRAEDEGKLCRVRGWKKLWESTASSGRASGEGVVAEPVANTEADWSSGVRSTVELPPWEPGEFRHFVESGEESPDVGSLSTEERKILETREIEIREMRRNMDILRAAVPF